MMPQNQIPALPKKKIPVVVLTGGGSGGHITPLLSLARALKEVSPGCRVAYIGHKGDRFDSLQERYHDFDDIGFVNGGKFRRYHGESIFSQLLDFKTLALNIRDFFRVIGSIFTAIKILRKLKPSVVFSKGGFVAVPVGIAAKLLSIPIVTHDSDSTAGLANKIIGRWAVVHATGMPPEFYDYPKDTIAYVGIPIDERYKQIDEKELAKFKTMLKINSDNLVLLITGGGLGARDLNDKVIAISHELLNMIPNLKIVHIAGHKNLEDVKKGYVGVLTDAQLNNVNLLNFTGELYKYSGAADLIVTRAGATSIAEYAAQAKPLILIPSPYLTGGHQVKNAQHLKKTGAVEFVANDAKPGELLNSVTKLLKDNKQRIKLAVQLHKTAKLNASKELAAILLEVANKQKQ